MSKEIWVDILAHQTRVALMENGELAEIYIERRGRERLVGNIYKGKVQNILPGMQAAFVDIGLEKNAFLYAGDILADKSDFEFPDAKNEVRLAGDIRDIVKQGQEIMVQVLKEPVGSKGARVTTHITLPGRTLVLMPTVNYIGVSRRIENEADRARLKGIMERIERGDMGIIVRTAAQDNSEEEFAHDLQFLQKMWRKILHKSNLVSAPRLIHEEEALVFRILRDMFKGDISKLLINDKEMFERVKVIAGITNPTLAPLIMYYDDEMPLFESIEAKIEKALSRKVWLKNGGTIVIDQTEALTAIDVNTSKFVGRDNLQATILETNREAALEIARQLRLRDISGIIVIDFIDMEYEENKQIVLETLREALKKDTTKSNVLGITQLGLVEMTRKKMRQSLSFQLQSSCDACHGDGRVLSPETLALHILARYRHMCQSDDYEQYLLEAHPALVEALDAIRSNGFLGFPEAVGRPLYIHADPARCREDWRISGIMDVKNLAGLEGVVCANG